MGDGQMIYQNDGANILLIKLYLQSVSLPKYI